MFERGDIMIPIRTGSKYSDLRYLHPYDRIDRATGPKNVKNDDFLLCIKYWCMFNSHRIMADFDHHRDEPKPGIVFERVKGLRL